jgi:hypothetical protein
MRRYVVSITTATGGGATGYSGRTSGRIAGIRYVKAAASIAFASTTDFTITDEETGRSILAVSNVNATADYDIRGSVITTTGGARTYSTGTAALRAVADAIPIGRSRVKIAIAQGGNTKTGTFHVYVD